MESKNKEKPCLTCQHASPPFSEKRISGTCSPRLIELVYLVQYFQFGRIFYNPQNLPQKSAIQESTKTKTFLKFVSYRFVPYKLL